MRLNLAIVVIMIACVQVSASDVHAQNVTLNVKEAPLRTVFETLRKQTGYQFFFDNDVIKKASKVTLQLKVVSLKEALEQLFSQQPLSYEIVEKTIVVTEKLPQPSNSSKQQVITGKVSAQNGQPLAGVTVSIKGTSRSIATDEDGIYSIAASTTDILIFQFLGYAKQEQVVGERRVINIILSESISQLDQVRVQGYGNTTQRLATGNIATINAETIGQQPVTNIVQALNGRVAGVQVTQNNSIPGSPLSIQIRGVNSLGASNRPLFVIDDVPFPTEPIASFGFSTGIEPTNILNPSDVESITILKDADATAIYGSRGANGVVLITTKKGREGKTRLEVSYNRAFSMVSNMPELMSTEQYLQVRRDAFLNSNITPIVSNAPDLLSWDNKVDNRILDWYIGNTADVNDVTGSFSGGNQNTQFLLSGNYHHETNVFSDENKYRRGNIHFSLDHRSNDQKLKINFSGLYGSESNKINTAAGITRIAQTVPNYPYFDSNGNYNWLASQENVYALNTAYSKANTANLNLHVKGSYAILDDLVFATSIGIRNLFNDVTAVNPGSAKDPSLGTFALGNSVFLNTNTSTFVVEPQLNYKLRITEGALTLLLGSTIQKSASRTEQLSLNNYLSDLLMESRNGGSFQIANSTRSQYNFLSLFSRLNYNWKDRYIVNATFRRDGSSRFGPNKQFGNFGSAGVAWLFSNEEFIKDKVNWFSYGKLRSSYGITGSDGIGDFAYLSLYSTTADYGSQKAISPTQIANPDYQWELTKKLEIGLDLGFFKDRILFSTVWYRNRSSNQLVLFPMPATTGFSGYTANLPAVVQNTGWEFDLNTTNIESLQLSWKSNFTLTIPNNKLLEFPEIEQTSFANTLVIGKPVRSYLAYQVQGIDPNTGIATIVDVSGNGTLSANSSYNNRGGDKIWVGSADPKWFAGLNNSLNYKGFQLDLFLQYTKQIGYNLFSASSFSSFGTMINGYTAYLDYWKTPGQKALIPKPLASLNGGISRFASSDRAFSDASFLRLKTVAISCQLPKKWVSKVKLANLQLSVQGQNLWTLTDYDGADPEIAPSGAVAIAGLRTLSFGLKASF